MQLIEQNPYHVIGVLAGDSQRIIAKQRAKINAFQKVGKDIQFDTDINVFNSPNRSNEAIEQAFSNIENNKDKIINALFWFVNNNHIDETALTYLQSGDVGKAQEVWEKVTSGKEVTSKNGGAFNNLGTLKIISAFNSDSLSLNLLAEGVLLKTKLMTSDFFEDFCKIITDETYAVDGYKELENFILIFQKTYEKQVKIKANQINIKLMSVHPKIKSILSEKLTEAPFYNVEKNIGKTKKNRDANPKEGITHSKKLVSDTRNDLDILIKTLGKNDSKYKMIADSLAKEVLQCAIDGFNSYCDDEELYNGNLGKNTLELFEIAKSISIGDLTKQRATDNIENVNHWIRGASERKKDKLISTDLQLMVENFKVFDEGADSLNSARKLLLGCQPLLSNMKRALGPNDDFYLQISTSVVQRVQGMIIRVINISLSNPNDGRLKSTVSEAITLSEQIEPMDMTLEISRNYKKNHSDLLGIKKQLSGGGLLQLFINYWWVIGLAALFLFQ
jgi:hypothetical protein